MDLYVLASTRKNIYGKRLFAFRDWQKVFKKILRDDFHIIYTSNTIENSEYYNGIINKL